jgi:hypothetical protein
MLYLNHLLILNGFPPSILSNANRFDGCSIEELIIDVIEGMQNTLKIMKGEALADITTKEIIDFLKENNLEKELEYAKKIILSPFPPFHYQLQVQPFLKAHYHQAQPPLLFHQYHQAHPLFLISSQCRQVHQTLN